MKLNKTNFTDNVGSTMKWKHFQSAYANVDLGMSLEEAYTKLGGIVPEAKVDKPKPKKSEDSK